MVMAGCRASLTCLRCRSQAFAFDCCSCARACIQAQARPHGWCCHPRYTRARRPPSPSPALTFGRAAAARALGLPSVTLLPRWACYHVSPLSLPSPPSRAHAALLAPWRPHQRSESTEDAAPGGWLQREAPSRDHSSEVPLHPVGSGTDATLGQGGWAAGCKTTTAEVPARPTRSWVPVRLTMGSGTRDLRCGRRAWPWPFPIHGPSVVQGAHAPTYVG